MIDIDNIQKTKHDIFQNNIDWFCKQVQTINDLLNGVSEDEDGSQIPAIQPLMIRGLAGGYCSCLYTVDPSNFGNNGYTYGGAYYVYDFQIANTEIEVNNFQYIGPNAYANQWLIPNNRYYDTPDVVNRLGEYLIIEKKESTMDMPFYIQGGNANNIYCDNNGVYINNVFQNVFNPLYSGWGEPSSYSKSTMTLWGGTYMSIATNGVVSSNAPTVQQMDIGIMKDYPVISNSNYNSFNQMLITNNITNAQTYNYTTNNNTYNITVGDNGISIPLAGAGALAYVDIESLLTLAVDDLNIRFDGQWTDYAPLTVPTYDEIKYEDRGSFYITPIKQIDKLPIAPDIADTVIDVSEPLGILSTGFGALLDSFNNIGVTLTLTFTFLSCLIINKLRGD